MNRKQLQRLFPVSRTHAFMNHAGVSPLPGPVRDAMLDYIRCSARARWPHDNELDEARRLFAQMVGSLFEEVAFTPNTSLALNIAAGKLLQQRSGNILVNELEYPSNIYPWLKLAERGFEMRWVKPENGTLPLENFERLVDDETRAIAISHVQWGNGFRCNLKALAEIAHRHNAMLVVDAIQSAGALPLNVKRDDVDFLCCASYKWLLGPPGVGFLYVNKQHLKDWNPSLVGWCSVKGGEDSYADLYYTYDKKRLQFHDDARKFELGTPSTVSIVGVRESLRLLLRQGLRNVERKILKVSDYLIDQLRSLRLEVLTPLEPRYRSGIVTFKVKNPEEVAAKLRRAKVWVTARMGGVRVSPHFYNREEDIDRLVRAVKSLR
ncbi:MAG: aminotransferase class V-fold PLP-dependent enzyme [Candidatus Bathyarchaeia archaeon]